MQGLALWAQQFTPRLACVPSDTVFGDALVLELSASERLFGGRQPLARRLLRESRELGVQAISWAPTSLAAIALARCGIRHGMGQPLPQVLAPLPLHAIDAVARHAELLSQLGCQSLGAVHALPRGALARRMDTGILKALDQAHGLLPDRYPWISLPARFDARLELPMRIDQADALMHGARHLLLQLCGWLAAQRAGVRSFRLCWCHDAMRSHHVGDGGELTIHTASTTRDLNVLINRLFQYRILRRDSLEQMLPAPGNGWGRGLAAFPYGTHHFVGHGGDVLGSHARVIYNPDDEVSIAYATNGERIPTDAFLKAVVGIVYGEDAVFPEIK